MHYTWLPSIHYKAMGIHFLMLFIAFFLMQCLQFSCSTNVSCPEIERISLLKFRQGVIDDSFRLFSWVGNDCCTWQGVECSKKSGRVMKLDLRNPLSTSAVQLLSDYNNLEMFGKSLLQGEVSPFLLNLRRLNYLDLSVNNFYGAIPIFFGSFKDLSYLNLSCSGFVGKVPHHLGNLSSLQYLDLANSLVNDYAGVMIDSLRWVSTLSSLKHLDLTGVEGIGEDSDWFLAVNKLPSLKVLNLALCQIKSVPPLLNVNFTSLASLDLSYNLIDSTIPLWLSNITGLMHLHLRQNKFHGPIPDSLGMFSSLTILDLSYNFFNTSIPESFCNLRSLFHLELSSNLLSGNIPTCLGQLSMLKDLYMDNNQLSGSIPTSLGQLSKLQSLAVSHNSWVGNLSENLFTKLERLERLYISSTSLSFDVSLRWVPPFQLRYFHMDSCRNIGPRFPQWLQTQRHIEELSISNSSISDSIPDWFENVCSRIVYLDLSYNQIRGKLPKLQESVERPVVKYLILSSNRFEGLLTAFPSNLQSLDVSSNLLTGHIPMHLCMMKSLTVLDLSGNKFSGRLPSCLQRLNQLQVLDVSNNSLHGHIPSSLGSLKDLYSLHLHNNMFEGELPLSLQNLTALKTLDFGVNSFIGIIPPWIGEKISNLRFLRLQSNLFVGEIPQQLCFLECLRVLDLAHNTLTGNIPNCIGNLTGMTVNNLAPQSVFNSDTYTENIVASVKGNERQYTKTIPFLTSIDLSSNNLVGTIPQGLMNLTGIKVLNISGNQLKGRIPNSIGNLKQLESLDLSRNKLSGPIPPSLSDLNYLSYLNLSFNELSGRIPTGNQLQTLNNITVYEGNSELCGAPFLKSCSGDDKPPTHGSEVSDDSDSLWFYAGLVPGFLVGYVGICGVLHFKESWRHAYFQFLQNVFNWIALAIAIKLTWLRRKLHIGQV